MFENTYSRSAMLVYNCLSDRFSEKCLRRLTFFARYVAARGAGGAIGAGAAFLTGTRADCPALGGRYSYSAL